MSTPRRSSRSTLPRQPVERCRGRPRRKTPPWGTPDPPYGGSWARAIDDNEVDILFIDKRYADLTNQMFTTATGGQAGPNLAGVHDIGLVIVGGDTFRLPLDVLPAGAQEPYTWTIPYDAALVSAMTGDVNVSLIDRANPAVRWAQSAIVNERTRLSIVSITTVDEGGTPLVVEEDVSFNVARQRLTRLAGALATGTVLTARYQADRVIEDAVAGERDPDPGHRRPVELLATAGARIGVQLVRRVLAAASRGLDRAGDSPPRYRLRAQCEPHDSDCWC